VLRKPQELDKFKEWCYKSYLPKYPGNFTDLNFGSMIAEC